MNACRPVWAGGFCLMALVLLAYWPVYGGDFLWDDYLWLWESALTTSPDGWWRCWLPGAGGASDYLPITSLSFWLQWQLFERTSTGYQVVNVALHGLTAILIWRVLAALGMKNLWAWFAAVLFALHPVNVATVGWITEQKNTLSAVFYGAAMLAWLKHDDKPTSRGYVIALGLFALGLLSKASGVLIPLVMAGVVWWRRKRLRESDIVRLIPFVVLAAAISLVAIRFQQEHAIMGQDVRPEGVASRLAAAGWAVWFYLRQAIWPANLMLVYPRWEVDGEAVRSFLPLVTLLAIAGVLWRLKLRAVLLALCCFVLLLAPILGFFTMFYHSFSLVADQWAYLAMGPIAALVALVAQRIVGDRPAAVIVIVLLSCPLAVLTVQRAAVFHSEEALWADNIQRNPGCVIAHFSLGLHHQRRDNLNVAAHFYQQAIQLDHHYGKAYNNLGRIYAVRGMFQEAVELFRQAVRIDDRNAGAHKNLGFALLKLGDVRGGTAHLRKGFDLRPDEMTGRVLSQLEGAAR